jgi:hypothetical protein
MREKRRCGIELTLFPGELMKCQSGVRQMWRRGGIEKRRDKGRSSTAG